MKNTNSKISLFQFAVLGTMIGNALFVGFGIILTLSSAKQDAWLTMIIATVFAIIPILILIYILNYKPNKNILEKNRELFGNFFGSIINFIIICYVIFMLIIVLWSTTYFCLTQYLSEVPYLFMATLFILTAVYAVIKGIETIARTNQLMFFVSFLIILTIVLSLRPHSQFIQIKPIMANGIMPLIKYAVISLSYAFPPLLTLLIIPKDDIVNNKKYKRYLMLGFLSSVFFMSIVFYFVVSVNTIQLAELFRYPAYFVQYKIDIAGFFQGVENFLSLHWILNTFSLMMLSLYFINRYIKDTFKLEEGKKLKIITLIIGFVFVYISANIFPNSGAGVKFMKEVYPYYIAATLLGLLIIICICIFFKRRKKPKEEEKILLLN